MLLISSEVIKFRVSQGELYIVNETKHNSVIGLSSVNLILKIERVINWLICFIFSLRCIGPFNYSEYIL